MRVAIYARFSSDSQQDTSIEDQVGLCTAHAAKLGWQIDPELIFTDYSVSGASIARAGFDRLYTMVKRAPPDVDVILTESTDRISRDIGDADRFFKHIEFARVRLICVNDGIDSINKGSRLQYTMKAMMADWYLEDLKAKTLRGLRGQATRGRSTGGLPLGYTSKPLGDPRKPQGFEILIDEKGAATVLRIFSMYRDGMSYRSIAKALHEGGVPGPRARTKHRRKGWVVGTIRSMLTNEKYIGRWTYGERQWRKVPGTNKRRYIARPEEEVLRFDRPALRIVPPELWDAVQRRRDAVAAKYGKGKGKRQKGAAGRRTSYPFSGLLECGLCGAPMVIAGGSSARYYRCASNHRRGTCENARTIREDVVREALVDELERLLVSDAGVLYARRTLAKKLREANRSIERESKRADREIAKVEGQISKLISFITQGELNTKAMMPVREALDRHQQELEQLRAEKVKLETRAGQPIPLPSIDEVKRIVFDLKAVLAADPTRAREALRQLFKGGTVSLNPQEDGSYLATSEILPLMVLPATKSRKPRRGAEASDVYNVGCAGRI